MSEQNSLVNFMLSDSGFFDIKPSPIHGNGLFATRFISSDFNLGTGIAIGQAIELFREKDYRITESQRQRITNICLKSQQPLDLQQIGGTVMINHSSEKDNIILVRNSTNHNLHDCHTTKNIEQGDEILVDYRPIYRMLGLPPAGSFME